MPLDLVAVHGTNKKKYQFLENCNFYEKIKKYLQYPETLRFTVAMRIENNLSSLSSNYSQNSQISTKEKTNIQNLKGKLA